MQAVAVVLQRWLVLPACVLILSGLVATGLDGAERDTLTRRVRTWNDATRTYSVKASFVECEDGMVRLQKTDGNEITVAFDRLCLTDRNYVRSEQRRSELDERRKQSRLELAAVPPARIDRLPENSGRKASGDRGAVPQRLYGIDWYESPEIAMAAAGTESEKPVMWFRVLGDLEGFM